VGGEDRHFVLNPSHTCFVRVFVLICSSCHALIYLLIFGWVKTGFHGNRVPQHVVILLNCTKCQV